MSTRVLGSGRALAATSTRVFRYSRGPGGLEHSSVHQGTTTGFDEHSSARTKPCARCCEHSSARAGVPRYSPDHASDREGYPVSAATLRPGASLWRLGRASAGVAPSSGARDEAKRLAASRRIRTRAPHMHMFDHLMPSLPMGERSRSLGEARRVRHRAASAELQDQGTGMQRRVTMKGVTTNACESASTSWKSV